MQDAIARARRRPIEFMEIVARCDNRGDAAAGLAVLLDVDIWLADQLLDLQVVEFLGQLKPS
jgi:hypothetical protein